MITLWYTWNAGLIKDAANDARMASFKKTLKVGDRIKSIICKDSGDRSREQMEMFHALRDLIAESLGGDKEDWKCQLKILAGLYVPLSDDEPRPDWEGRFYNHFGQEVFVKSLTACNMSELSKAIDAAIRTLDENQITWTQMSVEGYQ